MTFCNPLSLSHTKKDPDTHFRRVGFSAFAFNGVCSFSGGIVVSLLRTKYGFDYGLTGTLLSCISIGNVIAAFAVGMLTEKIGMKKSILILSLGHFLGYTLMTLSGLPGVLLFAFLLVGFAKGSVLNICTVLVGNHSKDKAKALTMQHCFSAIGACLAPFALALLAIFGTTPAILGLAASGLAIWIIFALAGLPGADSDVDENVGKQKKSGHIDFSFLKQPHFWILAALLFCQNGAEQSVNGWLATYFKDQGILTGVLSTYTVSIMWGATLAGRLVVAFLLKIKNVFKTLAVMGIGCTLMYLVLIQMTSPVPAILALFGFAFAMAGVNPLTVSAVGDDLSPASVGILIPIGGIGAIVMPYIIGIVADSISLSAGMAANIFTCAGIFVLSLSMMLRKKTGIAK